MTALRHGTGLLFATAAVLSAMPSSARAQPSFAAIQTQGLCSPVATAGRDVRIEMVCGLTPEQVGLAIAAARGEPIRVEAGSDPSCNPHVYARRDAVVSVVCG